MNNPNDPITELATIRETRKKAESAKDSKDLKKLRKDSLQFSTEIYRFISWLDEEMESPPDSKRAERICLAVNRLELCADTFVHFSLDRSFKLIEKMKQVKP